MTTIYIPRTFGGVLPLSSLASVAAPSSAPPAPTRQYFTVGSWSSAPQQMLTGPLVPLVSRPVYQINGISIDTPTVATAPLLGMGTTLSLGSSFLLVFANPSTQTQSLLTSSPLVTMTFSLSGGTLVTGPVTIRLITRTFPSYAIRPLGGTVAYTDTSTTVASYMLRTFGSAISYGNTPAPAPPVWQVFVTTAKPISIPR